MDNQDFLDAFTADRCRARLWRTFGAFLMGVETISIAAMALLSFSLRFPK